MKISKIEVSNVLALSRVDIELNSPLLMVLGNNEAGKSSLSDAISMAILGEPSRVKLKKELGQLLHDDSKKGRVTLANGDAVLGEYKLPGGEHQVANLPGVEHLPYLIKTSLFAEKSTDERRSFLFRLTNCRASTDTTVGMLLERKCRPDLVEIIKPLLKGGFPSSSDEAASRAKEAKGAFRQLTGDNWGSKQSEGWKIHIPEAPDMPDVSPEAINKEIKKHAKEQADVENGIAYITKLEGQIEQAATFYTRKDELEEAAGLLQRAQVKLQTDRESLEELENSFKANQTKLAEAQAGVVPVKCPCCDAELTIKGQTLEKFAGLKADTKATSDLALNLTKTRSAIDMMKRTIDNDIAAVTTAQNAANDLEAHIAAGVPDVKEDALRVAQEALAGCRDRAGKLRIRVEAMKQRQELLETAEQTNADAKKHHQDVLAWLEIADALAPDGIPAEILATAIKPVNDSLAILSRLSGWKKVVIGNDMEITAAGRLYGLMSESAKWRIDTLIACAIAQISELRFLVLDRFDVLDIKGRGQLVGLLLELVAMNLMDQAIICGTAKDVWPSMPAEVTQVFIENGTVRGA